MKKKTIAILLPYKDHFTNSNAGSASIWVKDFNNKSLFRKQTKIFGNTPHLHDLIDKKNYVNLYVNDLGLSSKNTSYVNEFVKHFLKNSFKLIEVHNRPSYIHQLLKNKIGGKLILIFHNNPLSLGGSESLSEREILLNKCDKLIFVSNWVKEKFFENFNKKNHPKCEVIYPSIEPLKKFPKKYNIISFVGKLNRSKGFHIFGKAIIKILAKGTLIGHDGPRAIVAPFEPTVLIMPTRRLYPGKTAVRLAQPITPND